MKNRKLFFLFPTTFSLFGLFTITPIGEDVPVKLSYRRKFEPFLPQGFAKGDEHHFFGSSNFCKYRGRVCMRDYGSPLTQEIISKHQEAFNRFSLEADLK